MFRTGDFSRLTRIPVRPMELEYPAMKSVENSKGRLTVPSRQVYGLTASPPRSGCMSLRLCVYNGTCSR